MTTCAEFLSKNPNATKEEVVKACGVTLKYARLAIYRYVKNNIRETVITQTSKTKKSKLKTCDVRELVEKEDPIKATEKALQELQETDTVDDIILFNYVKDNYMQSITRAMWAMVKRSSQLLSWQYRRGNSLIFWAHPKAIEYKRNNDYRY